MMNGKMVNLVFNMREPSVHTLDEYSQRSGLSKYLKLVIQCRYRI